MALVGSSAISRRGWCQRNCNHHPSGIPLRSVRRVAAHHIFVILNTDTVQQLNRPALTPVKALPPAAFVMSSRGWTESAVYRYFLTDPDRIAAPENHRHIVADHPAALAGCEFQQIDIIKPEAVCRYAQIILVIPAIALAIRLLPEPDSRPGCGELPFGQG